MEKCALHYSLYQLYCVYIGVQYRRNVTRTAGARLNSTAISAGRSILWPQPSALNPQHHYPGNPGDTTHTVSRRVR